MTDYDDDADWDDESREDEPYDLAEDVEAEDDQEDNTELDGLAQAAVYAPSAFGSAGLSWRRIASPPVDADGRLLGSISCRGCGYNLRGQPLEGTCSECGASVEWSAKGDHLCYGDAQWIGKLKSGMTWFIIAIIGSVVLALINAVITIAIQTSSTSLAPAPGSRPPNFNQMVQGQNLSMAIGVALGLVSTALFLIAVILLTTPEPGKNEESPMSSRQIFRMGWIVAAAMSFTGSVLMFASPLGGVVISGISSLVSIVAYIAMFIFLRKLALRIPDDSLASQTRTVMWGTIGGYGMIVVGGLFMVMMMGAMSGGSGAGMGIAGLGVCMMGIAGIAIIVFGIWGFVLTFFYRNRFAEAEELALASRA